MAVSRYVLSVLRIVVGLLFACHGAQKLFGAFGGHKAALTTLFGAAAVLEFVGGLLILVGLFTRPAAFILSGEMAVVYFTSHAPKGFWPIKNGGELAVLFCFVFLYLCVEGAGPLSMDALFRRDPRRRR